VTTAERSELLTDLHVTSVLGMTTSAQTLLRLPPYDGMAQRATYASTHGEQNGPLTASCAAGIASEVFKPCCRLRKALSLTGSGSRAYGP
jgi:hypothetical protein